MKRPSPRFRSGEYFVYEISRRNVFTTLIEICMETPCWCPSRWAPTWRTETKRSITVTEFCYKRVNLFFEELIKIKVIIFLILELFR